MIDFFKKKQQPIIETTNIKRALSIRQPYAEQIMQGTKKIEYRSRPTNIRERVYIYAGLKPGDKEDFDLIGVKPGDLPTGVLIGSVEIVNCKKKHGEYWWYLKNPVRLEEYIKPERQPQPAFFFPFEDSK